jgi:hypothetical protein
LGDTEGFGAPGTEDVVYGLQLSEGVYKRKEIVSVSGGVVSKFGDLSDVEVGTPYTGYRYELVFDENGKWTLHPVFDQWVVNMRLDPTHVFLSKGHIVSKVMNSGPLMVAFVPSKRRGVVLEALWPGAVSLLANRLNVQNMHLNLVSEFPEVFRGLKILPRGSTLFIEVKLLDPPSEFVTVLTGLRLKWGSVHKNRLCGVFIQIGTEASALVTVEGVQVQTSTVSLQKIYIPPSIRLSRLMFTPLTLSDTYLNTLKSSE